MDFVKLISANVKILITTKLNTNTKILEIHVATKFVTKLNVTVLGRAGKFLPGW
jgi:hypothetical protein